jgi:hypothetical protein
VFLFLFALSRDYVLSLALLLLVGFFSTGYLSLNRMLVGLQTERGMFGRVMAIYGMTWSVMPIALLPYGALVDIFGVTPTVAGGGILLAVFVAAIALLFSHHYLRTPVEPAMGRR